MEETYNMLTDEEKMQIIRSHIKNLQHNRYNLELSILAEQSVDVPNEALIIGYQMQIDDLNDKTIALENELTRISTIGETNV